MKRPGSPDRTRRRICRAALSTAALVAVPPMLNLGRFRVCAASPTQYSARALRIVERTLVIDMLGVLKLDFSPEAFAQPATAAEAEMFSSSGITAFHNAVGTGGPNAVEETLQFLAAWQGYVGRNSHLYTLAGRAADLERAKAEKRIAVIMGVQNAEHSDNT